jgi:hypothetical protein
LAAAATEICLKAACGAALMCHRRYRPKELSITENGYNVRGESYMTMDEKLNDSKRVKYFN